MTARVGIIEPGRIVNDSPYIAWSADGGGFTTTAAAYREFVQAARLRPLVATQLRRLRQGADLIAVGAFIRTAYFDATVPSAVADAISDAYLRLGGDAVELVVGGAAGDPLVEFLTGPQEVFLHVRGSHTLLSACKRCWASLFTDRAIVYREVRDVEQLSVDRSVSVRPMEASDLAPETSGELVAAASS
jgi:phosphoenolpyruvate synthase/pyruvate phosphate dikinase